MRVGVRFEAETQYFEEFLFGDGFFFQLSGFHLDRDSISNNKCRVGL